MTFVPASDKIGNMKKLKVLILMSSIGGGHKSVAHALQEALEERGHEVVFFDALPQVLIPTYSIISRYLLSFWGFLFWTSNEKKASDIISKLSNKMVEKKIARKVISTLPDFIISDHPFITKLPEEVFFKNGHIPLGVIVVDPMTAHAIWFKGRPDVYFIPTDDIQKAALAAGVPKERIIFTGYPVKKEFYEKTDIASLRSSLGLSPNVFTVMIGGSSEGIGKIEEICELMAEFPDKLKFQAIVVCGRNKILFKKLAGKYYFDKRFKILGFERRMPLYLKACDVVISKAGPTNLYEAVAAGKPFLAFSCMPGQEEGNLDLIKNERIGVVETDVKKIVHLIRKWIKEPVLLESFKPAIENLKERQKLASERVVDYIEKLIK